MTSDEDWTRRGLLALLCGGGVMAGAAMSRLSDPAPAQQAAVAGASASNTGARLVASVTSVQHSVGPSGRAGSHDTHAAHTEHAAEPRWSDVLRVGVRVENVTDHAVLLSPGQFRLRLDAWGLTVAPMSAERTVGPLAAGTASEAWIEYLTPPDPGSLALEFTDVGQDVAVALPLTITTGATL